MKDHAGITRDARDVMHSLFLFGDFWIWQCIAPSRGLFRQGLRAACFGLVRGSSQQLQGD